MAISLFKWAGGGSGRAEPMRDGARLCEDLKVALSADPRPSAPLADSTLYSGLDEVAEEQTELFRCLEQDVPVSLPKPCLSPLVGGSGRRTWDSSPSQRSAGAPLHPHTSAF